MICCEICNRAGDDDICKETGNRIEWDVFGITVMDDCPEREKRECDDCLDGGECNTCEGRDKNNE